MVRYYILKRDEEGNQCLYDEKGEKVICGSMQTILKFLDNIKSKSGDSICVFVENIPEESSNEKEIPLRTKISLILLSKIRKIFSKLALIETRYRYIKDGYYQVYCPNCREWFISRIHGYTGETFSKYYFKCPKCGMVLEAPEPER